MSGPVLEGAVALIVVFVVLVLACHYPVLDGFDQHFLASVLLPLSSVVD